MTTNGERLMKLETQMTDLKDNVNDIKVMLRDHVEWEEQKYIDMDRKYSAKWVETGVLSIGATIIGAVIFALVKLL